MKWDIFFTNNTLITFSFYNCARPENLIRGFRVFPTQSQYPTDYGYPKPEIMGSGTGLGS